MSDSNLGRPEPAKGVISSSGDDLLKRFSAFQPYKQAETPIIKNSLSGGPTVKWPSNIQDQLGGGANKLTREPLKIDSKGTELSSIFDTRLSKFEFSESTEGSALVNSEGRQKSAESAQTPRKPNFAPAQQRSSESFQMSATNFSTPPPDNGAQSFETMRERFMKNFKGSEDSTPKRQASNDYNQVLSYLGQTQPSSNQLLQKQYMIQNAP